MYTRPGFPPQSRRLVLSLAAIGIVIYSVVVLIYANLVPDLGIRAVWPHVASSVDPANGTKPQSGDRIAWVGGETIDSLPRYVNALWHLRDRDRFLPQPIERLDQLTGLESPVAELQGIRYVRVRFEPTDSRQAYESWFGVRNPPWQQSAISVVWFALEALVFWVGWLVFRRRPDNDAAALFFLLCIVTVGAYMGGYHWLEIASSPALTFVFALCAMALPQISLHFFLVFPTPKTWVRRHPFLALLLLYGLPSVLQVAVLWTIGTVVSAFRHDLPVASLDRHLGQLSWLVWTYMAWGGAMLATSVAALFHSHQTARSSLQRVQVQWLLAGTVLAGLLMSLALLLARSDPVGFLAGKVKWAMFGASTAFIFAYAVGILRYRAMQVDEILQRGVIYLLISFGVVLGYLVCYYALLLLTVWFSPRLASDAFHGQALLMATVVAFLLLGLTTARNWVQTVLDRQFFRQKRQLDRAMTRIGQAVEKLADRRTVAARSLDVIRDSLDAEDAAIYLHSDREGYELEAKVGERDFPRRFLNGHELVSELRSGRLLQVSPAAVLAGDPASSVLRKLTVELAQPIGTEEKLLGFLLAGPKENGYYTSADLGFLAGAAVLTTTALESAEAQTTLEKLNAELRERIARISRQQYQLAPRPEPSPALPAPESNGSAAFSLIRGSSPAVREMIATAVKVAASQATVLIRGESGTGKSLLAEAIHRNSPRTAGPFVKVHCAALSPSLLESELFGHVKGAFTGAHRDKVGRFQLAHGGTLFLDEVGDISLDVQTKLLRVLQEMTFEPVGSSEPITVDVRIISATNQAVEDLIRRGRLREDLFYRLNVISLFTPPLRDRREDIVELALHFLGHYAKRSAKPVQGISDEAIDLLLTYEWPGNIRELENVVERAVVLTNGPVVGAEDLPPEILSGQSLPARIPTNATAEHGTLPSSSTLLSELDRLERDRLLEALAAGAGNKSKAARFLGIPRSTFCSKLRKHGIPA